MLKPWIFTALSFALAPALAAPPARIVSQPDGAEMIYIPPGPFIYGNNQDDLRALTRRIKSGWDDTVYPTEFPRRTVDLRDYYIDRFEVTNERYGRFVKATRHRAPRFARYPQLNTPQQPVVGVGWKDADDFCRWSGKRLPTEEEWEKAARGTDGRTWPWGNDPALTNYNGRNAEYFAPVAVGSYPKGDSPYGVADMAGNVWEMTSGQWLDGAKAMRGGSFLNRLADVRTTIRWAARDEEGGANWLGFRCVKPVPPQR